MKFFDTNVLVYAIDGTEPVKRRIGRRLPSVLPNPLDSFRR